MTPEAISVFINLISQVDTNIITMLIIMIAFHALADYPLQGDFLAKAKNRTAALPGVPWYQAMGAHAFIHGGFVLLALGVWWIALLEVAAHAVIDDAKCRGRISFNTDQALHIGCKVIWVILWMAAI